MPPQKFLSFRRSEIDSGAFWDTFSINFIIIKKTMFVELDTKNKNMFTHSVG